MSLYGDLVRRSLLLFARCTIFALDLHNAYSVMTLSELQQLYSSHPHVEGMSRLLAQPQVRHIYWRGLCASSASLFASALLDRAKQTPFVYILGDLEEAGYFDHDLTQVTGE